MKRILAGVLALTMVFGSLAMPAAESGFSAFDTAVRASAETYGDYFYLAYSDGTVEITGYRGDGGAVTIPGTIDGKKVTSIGEKAFYECESLTSITIPNSVTSIEEWAFYYCTSLESIAIPNSVKSIGNFAFDSCASLKSITIPDGITKIGRDLFAGCSSLTSITIPDSVTSIGDSAFISCTSLTSITIPDSVTSIEDNVFNSCTSLKSVTIPNKVTSIGFWSFYNCTSLSSVTIPSSVTSIGYMAFGNCTSLRSITLPNSITSIDDNVFSDCSSLTSIKIPDSLTSIEYAMFSDCISLTSIIIPNSVTNIEGMAFSGCTSLKNITIPDSVTIIEGGIFKGCSSLTSIKIPDDVTSIESYAFEECTSLTNINIPDKVTNIGRYAFLNCRNLSSIIIPDSVTSIGNQIFENCESLTDVYYIGSKDDWNKISIGQYNTQLNKTTIHYNYDPNHTHSYTSEVTKSATCTAAGERTYTCAECGDTYTETISSTGHTSVTDEAVAATCTEDGKTEGSHCSVCGEVIKAQETVSATGHKFGAWKTTKKATCKETGTQTRTCSACEKTETKTIAKTAHTYKTTVVEPTYESQGYTLHTCTVCGESYKDNYTAKKTVATVKPTTFSCSDTAIRINWNKVEDAAGYRIYRYNTTTKKWETAATLSGADTLTYKQTGLKAGTTYKYKVKAYAKSNGKTYWGEASDTMTTTTKPAKPTIKSYSSTASAVRINWNTVTGATGYRVYRYDANTKKWVTIATIKDGSVSTYKDSKSLKSKTSYQYKVKAYRKVNDVNYWSEASAVKTCKTK